eukprot:scaffold1875_cov253-Pinguiococcus_pyrenoidosus.AAC.8
MQYIKTAPRTLRSLNMPQLPPLLAAFSGAFRPAPDSSASAASTPEGPLVTFVYCILGPREQGTFKTEHE